MGLGRPGVGREAATGLRQHTGQQADPRGLRLPRNQPSFKPPHLGPRTHSGSGSVGACGPEPAPSPSSVRPRSGLPLHPVCRTSMGWDRSQGPRWGGRARLLSGGGPHSPDTEEGAAAPAYSLLNGVPRAETGPTALTALRTCWRAQGHGLYPPGLLSLLEGLLCQGAPVKREKTGISQGCSGGRLADPPPPQKCDSRARLPPTSCLPGK